MKITAHADIEEQEVELDGAKDVTMKILIGPNHGSENIVMRHFKVKPGGHTPHHKHPYEHLVKIEDGKGIVKDENGCAYEVEVGQNLYVPPNSMHQFQNPYDDPFEFTCIILNQDLSK